MTKKPEDARNTIRDINDATEQARAAIRRSQDLTWTDPEFLEWEHGQITCRDPEPIDGSVFGEDGLVLHSASLGPLNQRRATSNYRRLMFQLLDDGHGSAGGGAWFSEHYYPASEDITWSGPLMLGPEPADAIDDIKSALEAEQEAETFSAAMQRLGGSMREAARNFSENLALYGNVYATGPASDGLEGEYQATIYAESTMVYVGRIAVRDGYGTGQTDAIGVDLTTFRNANRLVTEDGREHEIEMRSLESNVDVLNTPFDPTMVRPAPRRMFTFEFRVLYLREVDRRRTQPRLIMGNAAHVEVDGVDVTDGVRSFTLTFQTARPSPPVEPTGLTVRELQRQLADSGYVNPNGPTPGLSVLLGPERAAQLREHLRNQTPLITRMRGNTYVGQPILDEASPRVRALMARQAEPAWSVFTDRPQNQARGNHRQHQPSRRPRRSARAPRRTGRRP